MIEKKNLNLKTLASDKDEGKKQEENRKLTDSAFFKVVAMLIFSAIMLIFSGIAWFTMNKETGTGGMGVKTVGMPYELEVRGSFVENSSIMTGYSLFTEEFKNGIQQEDGEGNLINIFRTGGSNEKIVWRKSATSSDYPQGLTPGSHGELAFWVIPNQTGVLNLKFDLDIRGYLAVYEDDVMTDLVEVTDDLTDSEENAAIGITGAETKKAALNYINGHILFFRNYDSATGYYSDFCGEDAIEFCDYISGSDKTVTKDQPYPVTIYWIWVNDFGDMFLPSTSQYASEPLFADLNDDDREAVFEYLEDSKEIMFSGINQATVTSALTEVQNSSSPTFTSSLRTLTVGYDNADLDIGNNIDYILIELTASLDGQ